MAANVTAFLSDKTVLIPTIFSIYNINRQFGYHQTNQPVATHKKEFSRLCEIWIP